MFGFDPGNITPGDVIDDFRIVDVIATGGSSTTFRAEHRRLAREVSLKFVHPVVFAGDDGALEAARADAKRLARLEHPGIAPVLAAGEYEGALYVASALPQGRTLAELGVAGAITPGETGRIVRDVAAALADAHAQGIVHRDLRPECITADRWGHGIVRDFGVTRTSGRTGMLTRAEVLGALRYTAPEIVLGRAATPATDVYGLAAVAVWCLTGAPPYRDRPAADYVVFRTSAAAPRLALADGTPASDINAALAAAMALEPGARPQPAAFADAFAQAVERLPPGARHAATPLSASEPASAAAVAGPAPVRDAAAGLAQPVEPTFAEQPRPVPVPPPAPPPAPVPWGTIALCALVAVVIGLAGLFAGRAGSPRVATPSEPGAFALDTGDTWAAIGSSGPDARFAGARFTGRDGESATVGVVVDELLPGDPVPAALLPRRGMRPRPARSGDIPLVTYAGRGSIVVARPTSRGAIVAMCRGATAQRCASLVVRARGGGDALPVVAAEPVTRRLRAAMDAVRRATGDASAGFAGAAPARAAAATSLAGALRSAAASLELEGLDRGTAGEIARLRAALTEQAAAVARLGSPSRRAFASARAAARRAAGKLRRSLRAFERAGYPVMR